MELQAGDSAWIADGVIHGGAPHDCIYECVVFDLGTFAPGYPGVHEVGGRIPGQREWFFRGSAKGSTEAALADRIFDAMEREQLGYEWTTVGLLWQLLGCLSGYAQRHQAATKPPADHPDEKCAHLYPQ